MPSGRSGFTKSVRRAGAGQRFVNLVAALLRFPSLDFEAPERPDGLDPTGGNLKLSRRWHELCAWRFFARVGGEKDLAGLRSVGALRAYRTLSGWVCDGVALWLVGRSAWLQGLAARGDVYVLGCDISVAKHDTDIWRSMISTIAKHDVDAL